MATQTTKNKSRSDIELEPYNNWSNRYFAATMLGKKPEVLGGFLLGNFLKPLVNEGFSRLSDSLMSALFPTKKSETKSENPTGEGNIDAWRSAYANKYPALDAETNVLPYAKYQTPNPYPNTPSSSWERILEEQLQKYPSF